MSDWRKAAGVLRGAIPPGETPESMIRRLRDDGESIVDDTAQNVPDSGRAPHQEAINQVSTTKAHEMIQWARAWANRFAPYVADDNAWYTREGGIDGKDAGELGEGLAEVARLLTVAQARIAALEAQWDAVVVERDRLLWYVQCHQAVKHARIGSERYWTARQWFSDAEQACREAGDLESDAARYRIVRVETTRTLSPVEDDDGNE